MDFHFLDLSSHEDISKKISATFHVAHQSPQILLIKDGECIFQKGDSEISLEEIMEHATAPVVF
jgi:bacillithiol system protein YtxJ